jgi:hypothetical protein
MRHRVAFDFSRSSQEKPDVDDFRDVASNETSQYSAA